MDNLVTQIQRDFVENKQGIYEEISRDYKENHFEIKYNLLEDVLNKLKGNFNKNEKKTILAIYNGNPYIMLEIVIKSLLFGNNIILISEGERLYTSNKLIAIIQEALTKRQSKLILKTYSQVNYRKILKEEDLINRIIYLGDKRKYRHLKLNTNIEVKYNGYGSVCVYVDDEDEFEEELSKIEEYAYLNNLSIYKFTDGLDEEIEQINKDGRNNTCIICSKDEEKISIFKSKIDSQNIFVNTIDNKIEYELPEELFS